MAQLRRVHSNYKDIEPTPQVFAVETEVLATTEKKLECSGCGEPHLRYKCPEKETICTYCGKKGHIRKVCRNWKYTDGMKQTHLYEPKRGGGLKHSLPAVSSHQERLGRAGDIVEDEAEILRSKNKKANERALAKRKEENKKVLEETDELLSWGMSDPNATEIFTRFLKALQKAKTSKNPESTEAKMDEDKRESLLVETKAMIFFVFF